MNTTPSPRLLCSAGTAIAVVVLAFAAPHAAKILRPFARTSDDAAVPMLLLVSPLALTPLVHVLLAR